MNKSKADKSGARKEPGKKPLGIADLMDLLQNEVDDDSGQESSDSILGWVRMKWQFGDWESLAELSVEQVEEDSERREVALLVSSACLQLNDRRKAVALIKNALAANCSKSNVARILTSGVQNSLARASAVAGQEGRALGHFRAALDAVDGETKISWPARILQETSRLGLLSDASSFFQSTFSQSWPDDVVVLNAEGTEEFGEDSLYERVKVCLDAYDVHEAIAIECRKLGGNNVFDFFCQVARTFHEKDDHLTGLHYLRRAEELLTRHPSPKRTKLARLYLFFNKPGLGRQLMLEGVVNAETFTTEERMILKSSLPSNQSDGEAMEHGHALLMRYLKDVLPNNASSLGYGEKPVLVEVGSTREEVPGQGSTRKLAEFCRDYGIEFVTVDMDPHNTRLAEECFQRLGVRFHAVNAKGEEFLESYNEEIDFLFLDAYDFDHGSHSHLRQSRYKKFLGSVIDEQECHEMHLRCAQAIVEKLSSDGVICIDDTWQERGRWIAKGALAVPYLIENGFEVVMAKRRAVLLRRRRV